MLVPFLQQQTQVLSELRDRLGGLGFGADMSTISPAVGDDGPGGDPGEIYRSYEARVAGYEIQGSARNGA